jgi:hypothetical protein
MAQTGQSGAIHSRSFSALWSPGPLFGQKGSNRFDWHKHDAFAQWAANEPVPLVKADGSIVDGMGNDAPHSGNFRRG